MEGITFPLDVSLPNAENTRSRAIIDALEREVRVPIDSKDPDSDFFIILFVTSTETTRDPRTGETAAHLLLALDVTARNALDTALLANDTVIAELVKNPATAESAGLMSAEDFDKLRGIAAEANLYIHPETHPADTIEQDATHRFLTDMQISEYNSDISALNSAVEEIKTQLSRFNDSLYEDMTANPWSVSFESLAGLTITGFVWNKSYGRLEV